MKTASKKKATAPRKKALAKHAADKFKIQPGDNWLVRVHKLAQSVGGFDFEIPPRQ